MKTNTNPKSNPSLLSRALFTPFRSLALAAGLLVATYSATAIDNWTGLGGSAWDVGITPNWSPSLLFANGDAVSFGNTVLNRTVTVAASGVTPSSILVNNSFGSSNDYVFFGGAITGTGFLTKTGSGTLMIDCIQTYAGLTTNSGLTILCSALPNATITNSTGSQLVFGANNTGSAVTVNGLTKIYASQTLASLTVGSAGVVRDAAAPTLWGRTIDTPSLTIAAGGTLNLMNNAMVVRGASIATITAEVAGAFDGGLWDLPGITSSSAANDASFLTAVGVYDNSVNSLLAPTKGSFSAVTGLTGNEVIVAYTIYGDANLDGIVDPTDLALLNAGFAGATPALWQNGDFDYNGVIDASDYALYDYGFAAQSGVQPVSPEFAPACVPEPSAAAMLAAGAVALLGARRGSRKRE